MSVQIMKELPGCVRLIVYHRSLSLDNYLNCCPAAQSNPNVALIIATIGAGIVLQGSNNILC